MKKILALISVFLFSCNPEGFNNNNPYLPNVRFSTEINMNLPAYNNLNFVNFPVIIDNAGIGIKGVVVMKVGEGMYNAFELSCPSHEPSSCSRMSINGLNVKCSCENYEYSLLVGSSANGAPYPLKAYRAQVSGNILTVYN
ncbi:hypothetical protein NAT51_17730 [Flavobacterium amniphilum]|uniref:hypothetical protein n=1 Tax=Flavobacterium amniphilum TaxID=1834035 RepID=UPI00202A1AD3|nr:hypothetical protein [Flavobacterium amniphilum]MCL9807372.1 hypothetical protein [Flavobacterium amniphilum]